MCNLPTSTGQQEQDLQQHLGFLEEANRDALSASSACFNFSTYSIVAVLLISCLRRQPQPFSPSTWECIQLCVFIWLLTDHFPTNLSNYFLNTTFIFWPQTFHSNESALELCTVGKTYLFSFLQVLWDDFIWCHLVEKQRIATTYATFIPSQEM